MGFWGPQICPWLKIVTNFFFLGGATELKIWDLAPRPDMENGKKIALRLSRIPMNKIKLTRKIKKKEIKKQNIAFG